MLVETGLNAQTSRIVIAIVKRIFKKGNPSFRTLFMHPIEPVKNKSA